MDIQDTPWTYIHKQINKKIKKFNTNRFKSMIPNTVQWIVDIKNTGHNFIKLYILYREEHIIRNNGFNQATPTTSTYQNYK